MFNLLFLLQQTRGSGELHGGLWRGQHGEDGVARARHAEAAGLLLCPCFGHHAARAKAAIGEDNGMAVSRARER